jgi:Dual-action HEIGH metallo-peptidase
VFGQACTDLVDDCLLAEGGACLLMFRETLRESTEDLNRVGHIVAHEVGHCMGLSHGNHYSNENLNAPPHSCLGVTTLADMGLMAPGEMSSYNPLLIPYHENVIRSRVATPKQ